MVHVFDFFTLDDLRDKPRLKDEVLRYAWDHYCALQHQRSVMADEITAALAQAAVGPFPFNRWGRVVDYRFANHPLSAAGSMKSMVGGRFNIGDLDPAKFAPFPALYLASDEDTALSEKFGRADEAGGLTAAEHALRTSRSYTCVAVNGLLESVIDLSKVERLKAFVDIIREFKLPREILLRARKMGLPAALVTSLTELEQTLLARNWRASPTQFDVPHNCQVFGQLVLRAGIEGIVFPSAGSGADARSLAVFPQNLQGGSFVEIADPSPPATTHVRLDARTWRGFVC